jgi:glycosyltransferase involved in cell wall biosynthesis
MICKEISVVAPIYNESDGLYTLYDKLRSVLERSAVRWEIIMVNDGSNDRSAMILNEIAAADSRVKVVHFRRNYGQTAAMMAGFDYSSGKIIIAMDADLQNDPEDIPQLVAKLEEGYDVCSGWRKIRQDDELRRNLPSQLANRLISWVSGVHLRDYGCSLKAYRKEVIKDVKLYGEMHRFIPIYASWHGAKVTEIPVRHHPRKYGKSHYGMERVIKVLLDLIVVKFLDRYAKKPIYIFGGFGLINFLIGLIAGLWALFLKFFDGISFIQTPLPLLVVMTGITGMMCILMGLLAELGTRTWHESQAKPVYSVKETRNLPLSNNPSILGRP